MDRAGGLSRKKRFAVSRERTKPHGTRRSERTPRSARARNRTGGRRWKTKIVVQRCRARTWSISTVSIGRNNRRPAIDLYRVWVPVERTERMWKKTPRLFGYYDRRLTGFRKHDWTVTRRRIAITVSVPRRSAKRIDTYSNDWRAGPLVIKLFSHGDCSFWKIAKHTDGVVDECAAVDRTDNTRRWDD